MGACDGGEDGAGMAGAGSVNGGPPGGRSGIGVRFPQHRAPPPWFCGTAEPLAPFLVYLHTHRTKAQAASSPAELLGPALATSSP